MSERDERGSFLSRWSRRKVEARRAEPGQGPAAARKTEVAQRQPEPGASPAAPRTPGDAPADARDDARTPAPGKAPAQAPLPTIEELRGLHSEYRDFLRPGVDESLRRAALKKLFQDPHFNVMDGLDTYIDDYTKADPIPAAMLKALNQAQGLLFDREPERAAGDSRAAPPDAAAGQAPPLASSPPPASPEADQTDSGDAGNSGALKPGAPA